MAFLSLVFLLCCLFLLRNENENAAQLFSGGGPFLCVDLVPKDGEQSATGKIEEENEEDSIAANIPLEMMQQHATMTSKSIEDMARFMVCVFFLFLVILATGLDNGEAPAS